MSTLRLVIDPGHGGKSDGAVHNGIREDELVLAIAQDLRHEILASMPVEVEMTRHQDVAVPHLQRGAISKGFEADLVISLHANANCDGRVKGLMAFHKDGDLFSEAVANAIQREAPEALKRKGLHGVKSTAYPADPVFWDRVAKVLSFHEMPAVLVELGFLTNTHDAAYLAHDDNRPDIIECLLAGLQRAIELLPERKH